MLMHFMSALDMWCTGDTNVPLPDVNTQDPDVVSGYAAWIKSFVQEYEVDGLRIDGQSHLLPFSPSHPLSGKFGFV